ncbi:MAG: hypothetical protein AB8G05_21465 [Oligoflexales bacterium]
MPTYYLSGLTGVGLGVRIGFLCVTQEIKFNCTNGLCDKKSTGASIVKGKTTTIGAPEYSLAPTDYNGNASANVSLGRSLNMSVSTSISAQNVDDFPAIEWFHSNAMVRAKDRVILKDGEYDRNNPNFWVLRFSFDITVKLSKDQSRNPIMFEFRTNLDIKILLFVREEHHIRIGIMSKKLL